MSIQTTEAIKLYRASVLAERFGLSLDDARKLKSGQSVSLPKKTMEQLVAAGLVIETKTDETTASTSSRKSKGKEAK
jgi:hypothetical protein